MSSSLLFGVATGPDLLRLLAVPVFAIAAYRDHKTRRVANRTWLPLLVVGAVAVAWDAFVVFDASTFQRRIFSIQLVFSLGFVAPLGYVFWRIGGFGGADAKAIITLAVLFPIYPTYYIFGSVYPIHNAPLGVFSFTILSNTVLLGLLYPLTLAVGNIPRRELTPAMFVGRRVSLENIPNEHGRLLETSDGFTRRGLDLDALRMYLQWRGISLTALRSDPDRYRNTVPTEPNEPGDGSISTERRFRHRDDEGEPIEDDPWGIETFLSEHNAYGTTPTGLREGIETIVESDRERVWITPGIPFIVPMFLALTLALTLGDILFAAFSVIGVA